MRNTFIEQQHRIIRRFCLNAKIPIADGAKFHQMINECSPNIISCFEVFALNRNEDDFLENLMIIADIMKIRTDGDSPDAKNTSSLDGFSPLPRRHDDEPEKKLFGLELNLVSNEGEEDEDEENEEKNGEMGAANQVSNFASNENHANAENNDE